MLLTVIAIVLLGYLGARLWKSRARPKSVVSSVRLRKISRREPGPWDGGDTKRRGAR
jgi:hypothetical protein